MFKIIACHLIGDYVLQTDYMAKKKGKDMYIMIVHCFLYCLPFAMVFERDARLAILFVMHFIIDTAQARYEVFGIGFDQLYHYVLAAMLYLL